MAGHLIYDFGKLTNFFLKFRHTIKKILLIILEITNYESAMDS